MAQPCSAALALRALRAAAAGRNALPQWGATQLDLMHYQQQQQHWQHQPSCQCAVCRQAARAFASSPRAAAGQEDLWRQQQQPQQQHSQSTADGDTADFGYREVPRAAKAGLVGQVFTSVAPRYDAMNDLMSGGLHRLWKDHMVAQLAPFPGMRHLDVAGGTGDVALRVLRAIEAAEADAEQHQQQQQQQQQPGQQQQQQQQDAAGPGRVTVCDINASMLAAGRAKATAAGALGARIDFVLGDAEQLPFADEAMDAYTVAFGIRNVTDRAAALREARRVLKRGGRFMCLEFAPAVRAPLLRAAYDAYSFHVIPKLGALVAGDAASYAYLVESIRRFPAPGAFAGMMREAGFKAVTYELLTGGVVALHSGYKL